MTRSPLSPSTTEALRLLATAIRAGRIRRGWSIYDLAERVGVSHPTIVKVERGDPTVAAGTLLEAAILVGVPLFDPDPAVRARHQHHLTSELALLPRAARGRRTRIDDDF